MGLKPLAGRMFTSPIFMLTGLTRSAISAGILTKISLLANGYLVMGGVIVFS
jgi:hypothetical protein